MSVVYFTDRDLGKQFPAILSAAGLTIERHHDLFKPDGTDEEWLEYCGTTGRTAITHNERIRYTPNELAAVIQYKVSLLIVVGHVPVAELAYNFVATLSKIETFLGSSKAPFIAKIYRPSPGEAKSDKRVSGQIVRWYPK